jgi:hypothetical protein
MVGKLQQGVTNRKWIVLLIVYTFLRVADM